MDRLNRDIGLQLSRRLGYNPAYFTFLESERTRFMTRLRRIAVPSRIVLPRTIRNSCSPGKADSKAPLHCGGRDLDSRRKQRLCHGNDEVLLYGGESENSFCRRKGEKSLHGWAEKCLTNPDGLGSNSGKRTRQHRSGTFNARAARDGNFRAGKGAAKVSCGFPVGRTPPVRTTQDARRELQTRKESVRKLRGILQGLKGCRTEMDDYGSAVGFGTKPTTTLRSKLLCGGASKSANRNLISAIYFAGGNVGQKCVPAEKKPRSNSCLPRSILKPSVAIATESSASACGADSVPDCGKRHVSFSDAIADSGSS